MLKSILVGLDGSSYSNRAEDLALQWAQEHKSLLVGMGIIDEPGVRQGEALPIGASMFKDHRDQLKLEKVQIKVAGLLDKFGERCKAAKVKYKQVEQIGVPYEEILLESQRHDLILLGQQTYFQYDDEASEDRPGETLYQVLKHSPRPVLTVPKRLTDGNGIAVAYDGSLQASRALQMSQLLGAYPKEPVHLITVDDDKEQAERIAERAADYLRNHNRKTTIHAVASGSSPGDVILKLARKVKARALVMGAYGQSRWSTFFFGSVTKTILSKASFPLFLYH